MTRAIHQLVHTLSYGDAISGEVLALQRCLRSQGRESEIFALNVHPRYSGVAQKFEAFPSSFSEDVILHYSLGSPLNDLYRTLTTARRYLIYHNITPAHWFAGVNPRIVRDIEHGILDLRDLCACTDQILSDSNFNAREIEALGFSSKVLDLPIDPARWERSANPGILGLLRGDPSFHLLHVGRIAPNKCLEDILKVFYFFHHKIHPQSKLWFVGIDIDTELYSFALKRMCSELSLDDCVFFTGGITDEEVQSFYLGSSAYLCMSEHEGFCLPAAEAMHFGLPVVSYNGGALAETIGNGGILFSEKRHPEIAECLGIIAEDAAFRDRLIERGKKRVADLSYERFAKEVHTLFALSSPLPQ